MAELQAEQARTEAQQRRAAAPGRVRLEAVAQADRYAAALRAQRADLHRRRETLAAETRRRRQALIEADRDVKSLEKLCDRDRERYQLEAARQESRQLDENDRARPHHVAN
jgi:flagellar export protein FliJ